MEIKKQAKKNDMASVRVMAKELVRSRGTIAKMYEMKAHLQGISVRMQV